MAEMTHAGEYHSNSIFIAFFNGILIPDRASRLNDRCDPCLMRSFHTVIKREESIGS